MSYYGQNYGYSKDGAEKKLDRQEEYPRYREYYRPSDTTPYRGYYGGDKAERKLDQQEEDFPHYREYYKPYQTKEKEKVKEQVKETQKEKQKEEFGGDTRGDCSGKDKLAKLQQELVMLSQEMERLTMGKKGGGQVVPRRGCGQQKVGGGSQDAWQKAKENNAILEMMRWRPMKLCCPKPFDVFCEYRIRLCQGGGYINVEQVTRSDLYFGVSTYNHFYGCVEANNKKRWHYRYKGNCMEKVNSCMFNIAAIEVRGIPEQYLD